MKSLLFVCTKCLQSLEFAHSFQTGVNMIMCYKELESSRTIEVVIVLALYLKVDSRMSSSFCINLNVYIKWQCRIGKLKNQGVSLYLQEVDEFLEGGDNETDNLKFISVNKLC